MFEYGHEVMIRYTHFFLFFILYLSLISYHFLHQQQNQNGLWKRALPGVQESKYFCLSGKKGSDLVLFSFGTKTPTQLAWFNCFFSFSLFREFPILGKWAYNLAGPNSAYHVAHGRGDYRAWIDPKTARRSTNSPLLCV